MTHQREAVLRRLAGCIVGVPARPARIAIDGPDAAGKTTMADELAALVEGLGRPVIRASVDNFHRPRAERTARGPDLPEGYFLDSFDYTALRRVLLDPLGPGGDRVYRRATFDFRADTPIAAPVESASPDAVLLFDGVFLQRTELADCWDFRVYISVSGEKTLERALVRDIGLFDSGQEVQRRYLERYIPAQELYRSSVRPADVAHMVVENNDPEYPRLIRLD